MAVYNCKQHPGIALIVMGIFSIYFMPVFAQSDTSEQVSQPNFVKLFTSAIGLGWLTEYSPTINAVGFQFARNLGFETSYINHYQKNSSDRKSGKDAEEANTIVDFKLALDITKSFNDRTKIYGRFGIYVRDLSLNLNYHTQALRISESGKSAILGVGAAFDLDIMRVSVELDHFTAQYANNENSPLRILINLMSSF